MYFIREIDTTQPGKQLYKSRFEDFVGATGFLGPIY